MKLFEVKEIDSKVYKEELEGFLPDEIIDIHTHVHSLKHNRKQDTSRQVLWPSLVAEENTGEQITETYRLMFPGKKVTPLIFSVSNKEEDFDLKNNFVAKTAKRYGYPALYFSKPEENTERLETKCKEGHFRGLKSYLSLASEQIPEKDIKIFDFFPRHQFKAADKNGWIIMLHIPRDGRLGDRINLEQLLEIDSEYKNAKVIVAHIGRAYADIDAGDAFNILGNTKNLLFDFSANTNENMIKRAIETFGTDRVLFGSDAPITRMRTKRIIRNNTYVNLVPKGLYGDMTNVPHMEEVSGEEVEKLTYFLYEELLSFKRASIKLGLTNEDVEKICYGNAKRILGGGTSW